jgi:four helix bundle protein
MVTLVEEGRRKKEEGMPRSTRGFRKLYAYQKAMALAITTYKNLSERHLEPWLISQVVRSASSVYANIAEGYTRGGLKDYIRFLDMSRASLGELEAHLEFLRGCELIDEALHDRLQRMCDDAGNLIVALMRALQRKLKEGDWQRLGEPRPEYNAAAAENLSAYGEDLESLIPPHALSDDPLLPPSSFLLPGDDEGLGGK